eukprot:1915634-Pyramimonas_sp.AAC.1
MYETAPKFDFAAHPALCPAAFQCDEGPGVTFPRRAMQWVLSPAVTRVVPPMGLQVGIDDSFVGTHAVNILQGHPFPEHALPEGLVFPLWGSGCAPQVPARPRRGHLLRQSTRRGRGAWREGSRTCPRRCLVAVGTGPH